MAADDDDDDEGRGPEQHTPVSVCVRHQLAWVEVLLSIRGPETCDLFLLQNKSMRRSGAIRQKTGAQMCHFWKRFY